MHGSQETALKCIPSAQLTWRLWTVQVSDNARQLLSRQLVPQSTFLTAQKQDNSCLGKQDTEPLNNSVQKTLKLA